MASWNGDTVGRVAGGAIQSKYFFLHDLHVNK